MSITIKGVTKEDTAYDKRITFERKGVEYSVLLHWDNIDGFDLTFSDRQGYYTSLNTPEWVEQYREDNDSLEYDLDCLSDKVIEGENE
jgi:hypothetical protein